MTSPRARSRRASANDTVILEAAREVFMGDPAAPVAAVADRAGVGMSALYSRYRGKDELLRSLALSALQDMTVTVETALAAVAGQSGPEPTWSTYVACLDELVAGGSQALAQRLAGTFTPTGELRQLAGRAGTAWNQLHDTVQRST